MSATPATYKAIFEDDARGAAILEDLVARFNRGSVSSGGIDAVLKTFEHGGQKKVLDYIMRRIDQANGHAPITTDDEE